MSLTCTLRLKEFALQGYNSHLIGFNAIFIAYSVVGNICKNVRLTLIEIIISVMICEDLLEQTTFVLIFV